MKKKRQLHTPPQEIQEAVRLRQEKLSNHEYRYREHYREIRREKARNQKMPSHPGPQPKWSLADQYMGLPPTTHLGRYEVKKIKVQQRKEELLKAENERNNFLARLDIKPISEEDATEATPLSDALSDLDISDLPP